MCATSTGLITADTVPWRSIDEFEQARDLLEEWKRVAATGVEDKAGLRRHDRMGCDADEPQTDRHTVE